MKITLRSLTIPFFATLIAIMGMATAHASDTTRVVTKYTQFDVPATFDSEFRESEDKKNFKKLRSYFFEQTDIIEQLKAALGNYSRYDYEDTSKIRQAITDVGQWIAKVSKNKMALVPTHQFNLYQFYHSHDESAFLYNSNSKPMDSVSLDELTSLKENLLNAAKSLSERLKEYGRLVGNLAILEQDLKICERTIDEALRPETEDQWFRTKMSILFAGLIGFLLFVFFFLIYRRGTINIAQTLLSALGLQFITLFVLIIAIILFGILDILKGSELAAILAGISGYILGSKTNTPAPTAAPQTNEQQ